MERGQISDGDIVKLSWKGEEFYASVAAAGERDLAICRISPGRDYRQLPVIAVVGHWKLDWAHSTEPLGSMLAFRRGAVRPSEERKADER